MHHQVQVPTVLCIGLHAPDLEYQCDIRKCNVSYVILHAPDLGMHYKLTLSNTTNVELAHVCPVILFCTALRKTCKPKLLIRVYILFHSSINSFQVFYLQREYDCSNLLKHPLVISLLEHKWTTFGRYIFFGNLFIYLIFLAFLTAFGLVVLNPLEKTC